MLNIPLPSGRPEEDTPGVPQVPATGSDVVRKLKPFHNRLRYSTKALIQHPRTTNKWDLGGSPAPLRRKNQDHGRSQERKRTG